jgi:hypothetical protein
MKGLLYDNPIVFFIIYTIIIVGASWGITTFVLDERKINANNAEVEQYKIKMEIMENDMNILREDNKKYLQWLQSTPNAAAYIELKLKNLEKDNLSLGDRILGAKIASTGTEANRKPPYGYSVENMHKGEAFIDPYTGVSLGISDINSKFEATVILSIPGRPAQEIKKAKTGMSWNFDFKDEKFKIVIYKINWYNNTFGVMISQIM